VDYVATNFSVSPRLLLALLEYQVGALSQPDPPPALDGYLLGYENHLNRGLYLQLVWAANRLNDGFYAYRQGQLVEFELSDGQFERPDPWQNAATVALQYYFSGLLEPNAYRWAISKEGYGAAFGDLFGDPWENEAPHIPGSLTQPPLRLPFEDQKPWTYTGGPHTGWGTERPFSALDFAPPSETSGCFESKDWATAVADGLIVRSDTGLVVLDLDKDGDERTGWTIFYLHLATEDRAPVGTLLAAGDPVGHPSCEGGTSTGSHVHIARKYNGEWVPAAGELAFNLDGWVARNGDAPYQGYLVRGNQVITACECSNQTSQIIAGQ
jgi:LasA protease